MDKLFTLLDLCPSSSSHSTNLRLLCQVAFLSLKGAAMDSCMNGYANWCKLKVDMSMHHAYDKSLKTMGDISTPPLKIRKDFSIRGANYPSRSRHV